MPSKRKRTRKELFLIEMVRCKGLIALIELPGLGEEHRSNGDIVCLVKPEDGMSMFARQHGSGVPVTLE